MARKSPSAQAVTAPAENTASEARKPLVFISHDTRDGDIAEAFTNLLTDASGGVLQSFRSSDRKGVSGIEFGAEWYRTIMERLDHATDVVALLTTYSIDRPWLLYEAGVAKGKMDRVVFGLALGIPLSDANVGPFAQFQNSGDDEDSLTKLVLQLIRRNPDATPREEAVRRQVAAFRDTVANLLKDRHDPTGKGRIEKDTEDVAKLFEEVKAMFRELPERLEGTLKSHLKRGTTGRRGGRWLEGIEDMVYSAESFEPRERVASWLIATSLLRDDVPWLYAILVEANRAVSQGNAKAVKDLARSLYQVLESPHLDWILREMADRERDAYPLINIVRRMPDLLDSLARDMPLRRSFSGTKSSISGKPGEQ